jgi:RNA polymerase sigma-70 factor (ECF subfamily)
MNIEAAFKLLYRPLCLYAMHYLYGNIDNAEDVVEDCFVKLWEHQPDNPKSFLYTTVRNACIDRLRKSKCVPIDIEPKDIEGYITDEEAQDRSEREAKLWVAIDRLPERCRQVFLMSKRDGMKYKEIAESLGISERTVEHQVSKALKELRGNRKEIYFVMMMLY